MRTTVAIAEFIAAARALSERLGGGLGGALSKFARRRFRDASTDRVDWDPTVFAVPVDAEPIASEDVKRALDEFP